jgi:hypothetical protein
VSVGGTGGGGGGPGGGGGGGGGGGQNAKPVLSQVSLLRTVFRVDRSGVAETPVSSARKGTVFRYTLSEDARVLITIQRLLPGRRVRGRCVRPTRRNRTRPKCTRFVRAGRFAVQSVAGPNSHRFSGKIGRRSLRRGRYRATLVARDADGRKSVPRRLNFRVVRR